MTGLTTHIHKPHRGSRHHLARHLTEMSLAMWAGMIVGAGLFAAAVGKSVPEARREYAVAWVLVMAFDMTLPMVAWMLHRGHSHRSAAEMAAAMIIPALPIILLQLVVSASAGNAYMPLSSVTMIALIIYRRNEYRAAAGAHGSEVQR